MSSFLSKLRTEKLTEPTEAFGRATHILLFPLRFRSFVANRIITVPAGFTTDFASVPRLLMVYALFGDVGHASATVHDYLLVTGVIRRSLADKVFLEALEAEGVPCWRRWPMYLGVRVGSLFARLSGRE